VKPLMRAPDEVAWLLPACPGFLAEPRVRTRLPVAPDGTEQQCEVTTKEGMLDETILIMAVDKSATHGKFACAPWLSK